MKKSYLNKWLSIFILSLSVNAIAQPEQWEFMQYQDEFTDRNRGYGQVSAEEGWIAVSCDSVGTPMLIIEVGEFLGSADIANNVKYRIDKKPAVDTTMKMSNNGVHSTLKNTQLELIKEMAAGGETILIQLLDYKLTPHVARFSLLSADEVIGKVFTACGIE